MYKLFLLLSLCPAFPLMAQQQTIFCSSSRQKPHTCPADTSNGVLLIHEESERLCRQRKTWHYDDTGIHVAGGCSGTFLVNPAHNSTAGKGGYHTFGTGENAFHTNGPLGGAVQRGVDQDDAVVPLSQKNPK